MIVRRGQPSFTAQLEVPRTGSLRAWGAVAADFERLLAEQVNPVVSEARVESETRRGPDSVRVRITVTARAADVGQAAVIAWDVFRTAAGEDIAAWDTGGATAQIGPAAGGVRRTLRPAARPHVLEHGLRAPDLIEQALPVLTAGCERGTLRPQAVAKAVNANPRAPLRMLALDVGRCRLCGDRVVRCRAHVPSRRPRS